MQRRDFLKRTAALAALLVTTKSFADEQKKEGCMKHANKDNPSVMEQRHVPAVFAPLKAKAGEWFDVKTRVGFMNEHPSTEEHYITFIKLLVDGKEVAVKEFKVGGITFPDAIFKIKLDKAATLEVVENCNLHGTWISEPLKVEMF